MNLPKVSIQKFDGDVKKWPLFLADFTSAVDQAHKMAYLRSFFTDEVQNEIAQFMFEPKLYPQALQELQRKHEQCQTWASLYDRIGPYKNKVGFRDRERQPNRSGDFLNILNGSVGALSAGDYNHELLSNGILAHVSAKILYRL